MTGQIRHERKPSQRERGGGGGGGAGSGRVIKLGFKHGTQRCYLGTNKTTYFPSLVSKTLPPPTKLTNKGVQNTWYIKNTNVIDRRVHLQK